MGSFIEKYVDNVSSNWQPENNGVRPIYNCLVNKTNVGELSLHIFLDNLMLSLLKNSDPSHLVNKFKERLDLDLDAAYNYFDNLFENGLISEYEIKSIKKSRRSWLITFEVGDSPAYKLM